MHADTKIRNVDKRIEKKKQCCYTSVQVIMSNGYINIMHMHILCASIISILSDLYTSVEINLIRTTTAKKKCVTINNVV